MDQSLAALFESPELHFLAFDREQALFMRMDRESYRRSSFLDARAIALDPRPRPRPLQPLLDAAADTAPQPARWIFHVAHCGSTLLSRAIDLPGADLVLREPPPLRQLAVERASGKPSERWADKLRLARHMAARRFAPDAPAIVKANVPVNFILDDLLAATPGEPAILLHLPLEAYLLAILRDAEHRTWVDRITQNLEPAIRAAIGCAMPADTTERAAALWLAQMLVFVEVLAAHRLARSLDAQLLFGQPSTVVEAALDHFGIGARPSDEELSALMGRYSKNPSQPFGESERRAREANDRARLGGELARARDWLERCGAAARLPQALDRPLTGVPAPLL